MTKLLILLLLAQAPPIEEGPPLKDKHVGFQIRLFADTAELPPRRTVKPVDADLTWYESQVLRSWVVQRGGKRRDARLRILLGRLSALPGEKADAKADGDPLERWSGADLCDWVQDFSEMEIQGDPFDHKIGRLQAKAWRLQSDTRQGVGFLLRRKGGSYLLLYKHPPKWDVEKAILKSAASFRFTAPKKGKAVLLKLPGRRKKLDPSLDEFREAAAKRVARSIEGLPTWWYLPTDHYVVTGNVDPKLHRLAVAEFVKKLGKINKAYRMVLPPRGDVTAVSVVKVFSNRDQIFAHFSERQPRAMNAGVIGMWVNVYDELVLTLDPARLNNTLAILFHEGFHQYLYYAAGGELDPPRWFDEGTADFFGGAVFEDGKVRFAENPSRKNNITKIVNGEFTKRYGWTPPSLATLIRWNRSEFYGEVKWLVFRYSMAWSVIYFLRNGLGEGSPHAGLLNKYSETLLETGSAEKAYEVSFGKTDMTAFERDWKEFWLDPVARKRAQMRSHPLK
ncbi:MAG: hypothetical protein ACYTFG_16040 [Planctomycetota bacterium]|jgi:hypothetical protein